MTTKALEGLWQYIQSLDLSQRSRKWLAEKLVTEYAAPADKEEEHASMVAEEGAKYLSKEEILAGIEAGLQEMQERKRTGKKAQTLQELIDEL